MKISINFFGGIKASLGILFRKDNGSLERPSTTRLYACSGSGWTAACVGDQTELTKRPFCGRWKVKEFSNGLELENSGLVS